MNSTSRCEFITVFIIVTFLLPFIIGKPKNVTFNLYLTQKKVSEFINSMNSFNRTNKLCTQFASDWESVPLSASYHYNLEAFDAAYKEALNGSRPVEGNTGEVLSKLKVLHHIAKNPSIQTICETGFNYGHSSYNFLSANPNARVFSFDLGEHPYVGMMNETIVNIFSPQRFRLTLGNSTTTIPKAIKEGWLPLCDLIFVDGGHVYGVAKADLVNFLSHSSPESIVFFDDWPTYWGRIFGKVWDESLLPGMLGKKDNLDANEVREIIMKDLVKTSLDKNSFEYRSKCFKIKETIRCTVPGRYDRGYAAGISIRV